MKLPKRIGRVGRKDITQTQVVKNVTDGLYSPGADIQFRAPSMREDWKHLRRDGRRTQSLAVGKNVSPQEMIWALGGKYDVIYPC